MPNGDNIAAGVRHTPHGIRLLRAKNLRSINFITVFDAWKRFLDVLRNRTILAHPPVPTGMKSSQENMSYTRSYSLSLMTGILLSGHALQVETTNAFPRAVDSCTPVDNTLLLDWSWSDCYFASEPTVSQLNTCLMRVDVSDSCRFCMLSIVSMISDCLNTCGYDGATRRIENPTSAGCLSCLSNLASEVPESSGFLSTCGCSSDVSVNLMYRFYPIATGSSKNSPLIGSPLTSLFVVPIILLLTEGWKSRQYGIGSHS